MPKPKKKAAPAKKKAPAKKAPAKKKAKAVASNVISFTELFELKKKKMAEMQEQQQGWKNGSTGQVSVYTDQPKAAVNVRNGRTNGSGARHK